MKKAFDAEAKANRVYPIGGGLWSVLQPQYAPSNPATEFRYTQSVVGVPEFAAPKLGARTNLVTIDAELTPDSTGVLYALGGFSGGLALWVEKGTLSYEYNLFEIRRIPRRPPRARCRTDQGAARQDDAGRHHRVDEEGQ
jgi:hypothetical protein